MDQKWTNKEENKLHTLSHKVYLSSNLSFENLSIPVQPNHTQKKSINDTIPQSL